VFDRDGTPTDWTPLAAETAVKTEGYTYNSTLDGIGDCPPLRNYRTTQREDAAHIYDVVCEFQTEDPDDPEARDANDEWVEYQGGTKAFTEYYDIANAALDDSDGRHGVSKQGPTKIWRVHRVHSASQSGNWESYGCKVNSGAVATPGGVTLCSTAKKLLFLYATERPLKNGNVEVVYTFEEDLTRYNTGAAQADLLHATPVATVNKETGKVTSVALKHIYEEAAIGSAMGDE